MNGLKEKVENLDDDRLICICKDIFLSKYAIGCIDPKSEFVKFKNELTNDYPDITIGSRTLIDEIFGVALERYFDKQY